MSKYILISVCIAYLLGTLFGLSGQAGVALIFAVAWLLPGILLLQRKPVIALVALSIAGLFLGIDRGSTVYQQKAELTSLVNTPVTVTGEVADDPVTTLKNTSFTLGSITVNGRPYDQTLHFESYALRVQRGYHLTLSGKLQPGFATWAGELFYPKILAESTHQSWLERLRQRFFAGVRTALPDPDASFVLGLLIGVRALIPKPLQQQLARTGLSHLVAVSGYNLTIIAQACRRLTGKLGYNASFVITLWLIGGFVVLTGAAASIVRAAVVAVLVLYADRSGRRIEPLSLLLLAAVVTSAWKPQYLYDLGWLLSFTAFFGIAILAPLVEQRLGLGAGIVTPGVTPANQKRTDSWRITLLKLLIESVCAQLATLPLIMHSFGQLSVVSPLANLIILPLVPLAMLFGFVAGLAGMLAPAFCGWVAWPAGLLTNGMLWVINLCDHLPFSSLNETFSALQTIAVYALLVLAALVLYRSISNPSRHSRVGGNQIPDADPPAGGGQQPASASRRIEDDGELL